MTEPFSIAIITGSPSKNSRTSAVAQLVAKRLSRHAFRSHTIEVRELPSEALLHANFEDPAIVQATAAITQADGVVVASPVYKASYTGVLKTLLDLLPSGALKGKVVLPILTGGAFAHALALDYALRPVLQALDPKLVLGGLFLLDKWIARQDDGFSLEADAALHLETAVDGLIAGVRLVAESEHK